MRIVTKGVAIVAIALGSMVGLIQTTTVDAARPNKVTICHATSSYNNPYVKLTVDQDGVDGDAGNDKGQGDHYLEHNGPVFYPEIPKHTQWGDIIPPIEGVHDGLNWTAQGQAIYNNGCKPVDVYPVLSHEVACVFADDVQVVRVYLTNDGTGPGVATLNGEEVAVPAQTTVIRDFASGTNINLSINGEVVEDGVVECEDGTPTPNIAYDLVCDPLKKSFVVTFSNTGNADGEASVNEKEVTVPVGMPVVETVYVGDEKKQLIITANGKTVFDNKVATCAPGMGGFGGQEAAGGMTLPNTSGSTDAAAALTVVSLGAILSAGIFLRRLTANQF